MQGIKDRQLDNYFQLEENITKQTKAQVLELVSDNNKGTEPTDKLRYFIIWYLSTESEISRGDFDQFETALKAAGAETSALSYVRK